MPELRIEKQEVYAQARARGVGEKQAFLQAGYRPTSKHRWALLRNLVIDKRIAELKGEFAVAGSSDLTPVIAQLMRMASHLEKPKMTIPAITAAKGVLVEAARLKERLPAPTPSPTARDPHLERDLAHEAWRESFKSPAA